MRKLLLLTTALVAFSNVSYADTSSAHCNVLDKGIQFNKTMLSDFDKCWLDTHKADETSGIDGNVVWVRLNDKYFSVPLSELRGASSFKERFVELISDQVKAEAIADMTNEVATMEAAIEYITDEAKVKELQTEIDVLQAMIDGHGDELKAAYLDGIDAVRGVVNKRADKYGVSVESGLASHVIDAVYEAGKLAGMAEAKEGILTDLEASYKSDSVDRFNKLFAAAETAKFEGDLGAISEEIEIALEDAFKDGYNEGFVAGYQEGYADGAAGNTARF